MRVAFRRNAGGATDSTPFTYAATTNGAAFGIDHMVGYSITAAVVETVATLAGTLKIQASNNAFADNVNNNEAADAVWVDVSGSSQNVSGSGNFLWNVADAEYRAFRLVWTKTTGTGTFDIQIVAKGPQS